MDDAVDDFAPDLAGSDGGRHEVADGHERQARCLGELLDRDRLAGGAQYPQQRLAVFFAALAGGGVAAPGLGWLKPPCSALNLGEAEGGEGGHAAMPFTLAMASINLW